MNWVLQKSNEIEAQRQKEQIEVDASAIDQDESLKKKIEDDERKLEENGEDFRRQYERDGKLGKPPTRGETFLGKKEELTKRAFVFLGLIVEGVNLSYSLGGLNWPDFLKVAAGIMSLALVAISGHFYREKNDELEFEPLLGKWMKLFPLFIFHVLACGVIGGLTWYRTYRLEAGTTLRDMESGVATLSNNPVSIPLVTGIAAFALAWVFAILFHSWARSYKQWDPPYKWYRSSDKLHARIGMNMALRRSLPERHNVWHAEVEETHEAEFAKLVRKVERRAWWHGLFHRDEYPGRVALSQIAHEPWTRCTFFRPRGLERDDSNDRNFLPPTLGILVGFMIFASTSFQALGNLKIQDRPHEAKAMAQISVASMQTGEKFHEIQIDSRPILLIFLIDDSFSCYDEFLRSGLKNRIIQPLIRRLGEKDRIMLIGLDGSMQANGMVLFSDELPSSDGIFGDMLVRSRLRAAHILTVKLDSLIALRDSSFRRLTEIIHGLKFVSERIESKCRTILVCASDMIEESELGSMKEKNFNPEAMLKKVARLSLFADLRGSTILVVTPVVPMAQTKPALARRKFWESYFKQSSARMVWIGPDWGSLERQLDRVFPSVQKGK